MRRLLWGCAAVVVCALALRPTPVAAQGATRCDSPCKVMHLPLVGPRGAVCDSPCKLILLPLVTHTTQAKLVFKADSVREADMPALPAAPPAFLSFQVDKPAVQVHGSGPVHYPDSLKIAKVEGEVVAEFVVDTLGLADITSLRILRSTHPLFAAAVRDALPQMRFTPAELHGAKVRELLQRPFVFSLPR